MRSCSKTALKEFFTAMTYSSQMCFYSFCSFRHLLQDCVGMHRQGMIDIFLIFTINFVAPVGTAQPRL